MSKYKSHSFDIQIATECGMVAAVLMETFYFWIDKNRSDGTHLHEGRFWTYSSVKALLVQYPYLTRDKINTAIKKLVDKGLLLEGSFNENPYDRTKWYALTDLGLSYYEDSGEVVAENPKSSDGKSEMYNDGKSEMYIYNNSNKVSKTDTKAITSLPISENLKSIVKDWFTYKKEKRQPYQPTGQKMLLNKIVKMSETYGDEAVISEIRFAMENNYQGIVWSRVEKYKPIKKKIFSEPEPDFMNVPETEPEGEWLN